MLTNFPVSKPIPRLALNKARITLSQTGQQLKAQQMREFARNIFAGNLCLLNLVWQKLISCLKSGYQRLKVRQLLLFAEKINKDLGDSLIRPKPLTGCAEPKSAVFCGVTFKPHSPRPAFAFQVRFLSGAFGG